MGTTSPEPNLPCTVTLALSLHTTVVETTDALKMMMMSNSQK